MAPTTVATDHPSPNESTDTTTVAPKRPKAPGRQPSAEPKQEDGGPTYDLMALPHQPAHVPIDTQPPRKQPYDLSPNALASNQNHTKRRGGPRLNSRQPKDSKRDKSDAPNGTKSARVPKKPTNRGKKTKTSACSTTYSRIITNGTPASHGFPIPNIASQVIPYCDPSLITTCPKPPTPARMHDPETYLQHQVNIARHLAYNGVSGPYPIGDSLCDVYLADGTFVKIAVRKVDPHGQPFWCHMITGERLQPQDGSKATGKPVAMTNGALGWMEDEQGMIIPPEWTFIDPHVLSLGPQSPQVPPTVPLQQQVDGDHPGLKSDHNPMLS